MADSARLIIGTAHSENRCLIPLSKVDVEWFISFEIHKIKQQIILSVSGSAAQEILFRLPKPQNGTTVGYAAVLKKARRQFK